MASAETTLKLILLGEDRSAGKALRGVAGDAGQAESKLAKFGSVMSKAFVGGLLVGGAAMVKFGGQASDLAETQSKAATIFGKDSVNALDKYASAADKAIGQSKQTALDALATFGVFGKGAGLAGQDLVNFSTELTTLSSDMASFSNTSPEEAIEAIGAALRGESEPIRKYGVLLDDATLRNRALKMGLIETTKDALTPQQKALAAQAEILKQTKDQQGDFARTSDGLANKQRILKAEFTNMTTELGAKALPVMVSFVGILMDTAEWVDKNHEVIVPIVGVLGGFVAAVWAINTAARAYAATQMALNVILTANPIGLVIVGLVALGAALVLAYQKSETFRAIVDGAFRAIGTGFQFVWDNLLKPVFKLWLNTWFMLIGAILDGAAKAFGWVPGLGDKLKSAAKEFDEFRDKVNRALDGIHSEKSIRLKVTTEQIMVNPSMAKPRGANAVGTDFWAGGLSVVGERGPEIVDLPRGSSVLTAQESARMGSGSTGEVVGTLEVVHKTPSGEVMEREFVTLRRNRGGRALAFF